MNKLFNTISDVEYGIINYLKEMIRIFYDAIVFYLVVIIQP